MAIGVALGGLVTGALVPFQAGEAATPISQVASLVDQRPVSGTYKVTYVDYGSNDSADLTNNECPARRHCPKFFYTLSQGRLSVKLNAYRISERMKKYDFYLLDVDSSVDKKKGTGGHGTASFKVAASQRGLIDVDDTRSVSKKATKCTSFPVSVGAGFYGASAAIGVGSIRYCAKSASFTMKQSGTAAAVYTATSLPKINALTTGRIVKVRAGTKPNFAVRVTYPADTCLKRRTKAPAKGQCSKFKNGSRSMVYRIGTSG
ncbi:hypothetical protein [Aeromicrobium duanguangcaii]|uniref:hypothetical protein n=1 Tax=Aeromicrobium duanguangcaii TaxID=2968086 RepID=UPI002017B9BC|nr:hypothetical protein [Aeromicrobium duanguangcaii]MCL3837498.1 hypothetical protein [Aeromicrobium duanguangcaii]